MNLETWLKQNHPQGEQMGVVEALCTALNEAHARGVVHPAIEPSNIDLDPDGGVDLGEAVRGVASGGAARYRAPEVTEGNAHSAAADIYAAGVIFFEMLSGRTFPAGADRVPSLADIRPDLSRDLTDAVMGCLEKGPDWRPRDLSYLLQVVAQVRGNMPSKASAPRVARSEAPAPKVAAPRAKPAPSRSRVVDSDLPLSAARDTGGRSSLPMILVAVVVLAGGGVGAWFWLQSQKAPPSAATPRPAVTPPPIAGTTPTPVPSATPGGVASAPQLPAATAQPAPTAAASSAAPTPLPPTGTITQPLPTPVPTPLPTPPPVTAVTTTPASSTTATTATAPPPVAAQPTQPVPAAEYATLTAVTPLSLKRGAQAMLDVRGTALRSDHQVRILSVKERGVSIPVRRVKWVDTTLMKVLIEMEPNLAPGLYNVYVEDQQGGTNAIAITVTK